MPDKLPADLEELKASVGMSALLTSDRGRRSQVVRAFCEPQQTGRPGADGKVGENSPTFTFTDFAALKFKGLTGRPSVRKAYEGGEGEAE